MVNICHLRGFLFEYLITIIGVTLGVLRFIDLETKCEVLADFLIPMAICQ